MRSPRWALLAAVLLCAPLAGQNLQIHHLDVDQGDATLIVLPNGRSLLVDAGLHSRGAVVARYLQRLGLGRIDAFVATHYDRDHYGGVDQLVASGIRVGHWYDRGSWAFIPATKLAEKDFVEYRQTVGSPTQLLPDMRLDLDESVSIVVVASNGHVRGATGRYPFPPDENDYSIALLLNWRGFNYFIGGDLTEPIERRLVLEAAIGDVDVYKVSHHGSETSSSRAFLALIRPEVAIISNGSHCGFHHPRPAVLAALREFTSAIYQTNKYVCSAGIGANAPDEFIGDLVEAGDEGAVVVTVGADEYVVTLPGRPDIDPRRFPIERP